MKKRFQFRVSELGSRYSSSMIVSVEDNIITKAANVPSENPRFWSMGLPEVSNVIGKDVHDFEKELRKIMFSYQRDTTIYIVKRKVQCKDKCNQYLWIS